MTTQEKLQQVEEELSERREAMADIVRVMGRGCSGLANSEIAPTIKQEREQLKAELAMAYDAAEKGKAGRKLGTAYKECQKENDRLRAALEKCAKMLNRHHNHASESCNVFFEQDGKPIDIMTDLAVAYADSALWEETFIVLSDPLIHQILILKQKK